MVAELIGKYIWLVQTLSAAGSRGLSLSEITDRYSRHYNQNYPRRTFNNHLTATQDVFGIEILCNRSTNRYYIPYAEDAINKDDSIKWMVNTFTVNNLLTMSKARLSGRISVEEIPSGQKYLTSIMDAMQEGKELEIEYVKYKNSRAEILHIQPFALKEHERRWYLVAFCQERASGPKTKNSDKNAWRVYGLDRIASLKETEANFKMPADFDVEELFSRSYGIYFPQVGQEAVTIRFSATDEEARYLNDLPLHWSQKAEPENGKNVFSIRAIPNDNLIMDLCRLSDRIKILEPQSVIESVKAEFNKGLKLYK